MDHVGYTNRHLHQRSSEHHSSKSSIGKQMQTHGVDTPAGLLGTFRYLKSAEINLTAYCIKCFLYKRT